MSQKTKWEKVSISRSLVQFRDQLIPDAVRVKADVQIPSSGFATSLELGFNIIVGEERRISCEFFQATGPVTDNLFQKFNLAEIGEEVFKEWLDDPSHSVGDQTRTVVAPATQWDLRAKQIGRQLEMLEVAWVYLQAPTRGTQNVLEVLGYKSKATAVRRVMATRSAGMIPPVGASDAENAAALEVLRKERSSG